jgi:ParB family chromosome partitioning protein
MSENSAAEKSEGQTGRAPQRRKLGKGLGALMGEARREEPLVRDRTQEAGGTAADNTGTAATADTANGLASLPVSRIAPHPDQPRRHFDEDKLAELAASIAARGVIQPVIVRPMAGGKYQLVAGERRWRAAQKARLHEIPALIRDLEERDVMALALIENVQREDLNPVEEARAYQRLSEDEGLTQAEIARIVEKSRSHVANLMRLLGLPESVLDHVEQGRLTMGHARALIGHDAAESIAREAVAKGLSVRDVEKAARKSAAGEGAGNATAAPSTSRRDGAVDADIEAVQRHLEDLLGLSVKITPDAKDNTGTVAIRYRTLDQLDLVCQRLSGGGI